MKINVCCTSLKSRDFLSEENKKPRGFVEVKSLIQQVMLEVICQMVRTDRRVMRSEMRKLGEKDKRLAVKVCDKMPA